ncbi:hypothetical protein A0H76_821 [Hepatospora eriocheir]|uniref:Uncharacterized protein n=1 Tax=Hepatospora eriocheir TaxID=1081669 RepID=A0A1X0QI57_9MICR|nr:hypothetical protein A0H76_821 [Hepatospora eriocheir]
MFNYFNHSPEYVNLNSKDVNAKDYNTVSQQTPNYTTTPPVVKFKIKGNSLEFDQDYIAISVLVDPDSQNTYQWLKYFKLCKKDCKWTNEEALIPLKRSLEYIDERSIIEPCFSYESAMKLLIEHLYPCAKFNYYLNQLENLCISNFLTIRNYYQIFRDLVEQANYCARNQKLYPKENLHE